MKFNFSYSVEAEKKLIKTFHDLKEWMVEIGYGNSAVFPGKADPFKKSLDEMYKLLEDEYDEGDYKEAKTVVVNSFNPVEQAFAGYMTGIFGKRIDREYIVTLSKYGFGGLYHLLNQIAVQFTAFKEDTIKYIIMHETTHLFIEEDVLKYEVNQHEKERIVTLLQYASKLLPIEIKYPALGGTEAYMDDLFKELFFSDREKFFKEITNRRKETKQ